MQSLFDWIFSRQHQSWVGRFFRILTDRCIPDLEVNLGEKKFTLAAGRISWCVTVAPSLVDNMWIITQEPVAHLP